MNVLIQVAACAISGATIPSAIYVGGLIAERRLAKRQTRTMIDRNARTAPADMGTGDLTRN
jgi:ribosomal protein L18